MSDFSTTLADSLAARPLELDTDRATVESVAPDLPMAPDSLDSGDPSLYSLDTAIGLKDAATDQADGFLVSLALRQYWIPANSVESLQEFASFFCQFSGSVTLSELQNALDFAGLEFDLPSGRRVKGFAGDSVRKVCNRDFDVNSIQKDQWGEGVIGAWKVGYRGSQDSCQVGDAYGVTTMIVQLLENLTLSYEGGESSWHDAITAEFNHVFYNRVISWENLKGWGRSILKYDFNAIEVASEGLIIPVTTSEGIQRGMANGIIADIQAIRANLDQQIKNAEKRGSTLGSLAATRAIGKLENLLENAEKFADVIGSDSMQSVRLRAKELIAFCGRFTNATTIRGSLLELD